MCDPGLRGKTGTGDDGSEILWLASPDDAPALQATAGLDVPDRATQGCFNVTSNCFFGDTLYQKTHPAFKNLKRDDHPSKNQLKREETDRDMSLES